MKQLNKCKTILLIVCMVLLFWGVSMYYIHWNRVNYEEEATRIVTETIEQTSASLDFIITGELNTLNAIADSIPDTGIKEQTEIQKQLMYFINKFGYVRMAIVATDGEGYTSDGNQLNISNEEGFQKALRGSSNLSNPFTDKVSGKEVIAITSPIRVDGKIKGVLSATRYTQNLLFGISIFDGEGLMNVIDQQGNIILRSPYQDIDDSFTNVFTELSRNNDEANAQQLKKSIQTGQSYVSMSRLNGEEVLIGFVPIQKNEGMYIFTSIPKEIILSEANIAKNATFQLCFAMFLILLFSFIMWYQSEKKQHREVEKIAFIDELTQLSRLKKFSFDAQKILEKNPMGQYAIAQFDIDQFKYINEKFGHQIGDTILIHMADTLRMHKEDGDLLGRISGDRFALMTRYNDKGDLMDRLHQLLAQLSKFQLDGGLVNELIIHCGIYCIKDNEWDIPVIIDRTRIACNSLKGSYVSSCMIFDNKLLEQMIKEKDIVSKMRLALENDEFNVYLQPKTDINTCQTVGAEALVRWEDPVNGIISPGLFIPIFERNGFIVQLDLFVFKSVCQTLSKWISEGRKVYPISINFSLNTMIKSELVTHLKKTIDFYGIPAELIEIEIIESTIFDNLELLQERMKILRNMGFTIAIDDFGSGYSSLNVLQHLPVDVLKLDREFLLRNPVVETGEIVISSIVDLAKKLQLKVVAEGVETESHISFLKKVNCTTTQGYYFARPMPIVEFEQYYLC